jgi:DNA polymerase-4
VDDRSGEAGEPGDADDVGAPTAWVLHVDLDEFLAAVEIARRPELRGRPVVVGGTGDPARPRTVVATASYEARRFGVRSGMTLAAAARRCPDAVFLPHDRPAYEAASATVMTALRTLPVVVEEGGWDEAFLAADTADPEDLAAEVQRTVRQAAGLVCSVGIGRNKLQAKQATALAKPAGVARISDETWLAVMGDRPVTALWGIGPKTAGRLRELGVRSVRQLAAIDRHALLEPFTPRLAYALHRMGQGQFDSPVDATPHVARSRSREETFTEDLTDRAAIEAHLDALARAVTADAVAAGRTVRRVAVKVRVAPYFTSTKIRTLPAATTDPDEIAGTARELLARFEPLRPVRLLGVRGEYEREPDG